MSSEAATFPNNEETGSGAGQTQNDLVKAVDQLLNNLGPKFSKVSTELFAKMDEMSARLDEMETAIKAGNETSTDGG
ncbi:hypothetical protein ACLMJK_000673 [Lecanora helva]